MKIIITESQYQMLMEQEEQEVLHIPSLDVFGGWNNMRVWIERRGNPPFSIGGDLDLSFTHIRTLGNLQSVGGDLNLANTDIQYLWKLKSVGGSLILRNDTSVSSLGFFGDLKHVGGHLDLKHTPITEDYSEEQIRQMIDVKGKIYL
jgi:hypothetical protein